MRDSLANEEEYRRQNSREASFGEILLFSQYLRSNKGLISSFLYNQLTINYVRPINTVVF